MLKEAKEVVCIGLLRVENWLLEMSEKDSDTSNRLQDVKINSWLNKIGIRGTMAAFYFPNQGVKVMLYVEETG